MPPKAAPKPTAERDIGNPSTSSRMANPSFAINIQGREGSSVPADNSAQRAQRSHASAGNAVAGDQGRQNPPTSERYHSSPLLGAGQGQPGSMRELAMPSSPIRNHARENLPPEVPQIRDTVQRSQRNIAVVGNDDLQRRHPHPARDPLQPRQARSEPNLNMVGVAQTVIPMMDSFHTLARKIVVILVFISVFMFLVLAIFKILGFFFPADAMTDSPRLLFRVLGSGYSNAATISEVVFPLSVSNPLVWILVIAGILLLAYATACCANVCYTSPRY